MIPIQLGGNSILPATLCLGPYPFPVSSEAGCPAPMAQAGAGFIPNCPAKKDQGQSIDRDLYLIQFHDIKKDLF